MSKKDKEEDICAKVLLDYLSAQNRPYNASEIENNLKREHGFGKSLVTRVLENLTLENKLLGKTYGKQKIYFALQASATNMSEEEIRTLEFTTNQSKAEISQLTKEIKELESAISKRLKTPSGAQLREEIKEEKEIIAKLQAKLVDLKEIAKGIDPEKQKTLKRKRDLRVGEWRKRKRIASNILDMILEGYPKPKKALLEDISIDTDEDAGVTCPRD